MGKCSKEWAILKCPKTCSGGECCIDKVKVRKCLKWKNKGKCSKKWVAKNCPKTCHLCENSKQQTPSQYQKYDYLQNYHLSTYIVVIFSYNFNYNTTIIINFKRFFLEYKHNQIMHDKYLEFLNLIYLILSVNVYKVQTCTFF